MSERRLDRKKMRYGLSVSIVERQCDTRKGEKRVDQSKTVIS